ncbi:hypothetical protein GCM10007275_21690 [Jeotgalicoccus coquinae]|nr:hypothetical protein GCM10007275_21690 [Jeotgalicoccus coquinae]
MSVLRKKTIHQFEIEKAGINAEYDSDTGDVCTCVFRYTVNGAYNNRINSHSSCAVAAAIDN